MEQSTSVKSRIETDVNLCMCQEPSIGILVSDPSEEAYSKFLEFVHEIGQYGDADYAQISGRLHGYTASKLKDCKAKWHRKCYGSTCHSGHLERAKARYQKACQKGDSQHVQQKHGRPSSSATSATDSRRSENDHFTRSSTSPFNVMQCFFCQDDKEERVNSV